MIKKDLNYRQIGKTAYYACTNSAQYGIHASSKDWRQAIAELLLATNIYSASNVNLCLLANSDNRLYSKSLLIEAQL